MEGFREREARAALQCTYMCARNKRAARDLLTFVTRRSLRNFGMPLCRERLLDSLLSVRVYIARDLAFREVDVVKRIIHNERERARPYRLMVMAKVAPSMALGNCPLYLDTIRDLFAFIFRASVLRLYTWERERSDHTNYVVCVVVIVVCCLLSMCPGKLKFSLAAGLYVVLKHPPQEFARLCLDNYLLSLSPRGEFSEIIIYKAIRAPPIQLTGMKSDKTERI